MLLSPDDAACFVKLHRAFMYYVSQRLGVLPDIASPDQFGALSPELRLEVRNAFADNLDLVESFVDENPFDVSDEEKAIVLSWRDQVSGRFYVFRQLKKYMVFLSSDSPPVAYGVVAITDPLKSLLGNRLPVMTETVLLPFKDKIVYDGLISSYGISFGGGIKQMLNDSYREAKDRLGIVTSLPVLPPTIPAAKPNKTKRRKATKTPSRSDSLKPILDSVIAITDGFCREHLNDEYAELCRKLAEKLSRKRPSPLLRGKAISWACGIIRTIGWVNFLDDQSTQPHMKLRSIDKALGVGESTGQGKSKEIRKTLKIQPFDIEWTLPSRMDDNPEVWLAEFNGFVIDLRNAPREVQELAFENGLIPYIPADGKTDAADIDHSQLDGAGKVFQFKITLNNFKPAIWRRIQVQNCSLDKLHEHIQVAMGWTNSHLHQFEIDGRRYGDPDLLNDGFMDFECVDSTVTNISEIVPSGGGRFSFLYEYDFGDGWEHDVLFEGFPESVPGQQYPHCIEGERACPPEDVGGVWGYEEFLEAIADPNHERHDETVEWAGSFDPDPFDAAKVTQFMREGIPTWR